MIQQLLRISAFVLSLYGYASCFHTFLRFDRRTTWLSAICFNILVLYAAAYAGLLKQAGIALFAFGCAAALVRLGGWVGSVGLPNISIAPVHIWLAFYIVLFVSTFLDTNLEHYDNFSHWALIVKFLFTQGRLPGAMDTIISFVSYPMGSSLFVYFATLICGFSDQVMLLGQFIMIVSCLYAMFSLLGDQKSLLPYAVIFFVIALFNVFNIAIRMNNLLVDFLMPLIALGGIAGIDRMRENEWNVSLYLILVGGVLGLVKTSALLFLALFIVFYWTRILRLWKDSNGRNSLLLVGFGATIASLVPVLIWTVHVDHSFSVQAGRAILNWQQFFTTWPDTAAIALLTQRFLSAIFNPDSAALLGIALTNLIMVAAHLLIRIQLRRKSPLLRHCLVANAAIVLYYAGIYGTYLFYMPAAEAYALAGLDRYQSSIIIFALGIAVFSTVKAIDAVWVKPKNPIKGHGHFRTYRSKVLYEASIAVLVFVSTMLLLSENNGLRYNMATYDQSIPAQFLAVTKNDMELKHTRYLVVSTDAASVGNGYTEYAGRYYLFSPNVSVREDFVMDATAFDDLLRQYDEVVILEEHHTFSAMIHMVYGIRVTPGVYSVQEICSGERDA